jgi:hypothetical protein
MIPYLSHEHIQWLLDCHDRHSQRPKVSRVSIHQCFYRYLPLMNALCSSDAEKRIAAIVDDLMAIINGYPEKVWCKHITFSNGTWGLAIGQGQAEAVVFENWTCCPVCGKARPAE